MAPLPPPARAEFAARLKELRTARGFNTARKLAQALGIDENRYTRYERAEVEPDLTLFVRICETLHVSPNDLLAVAATVVPTGFADPPSRIGGRPAARLECSNALYRVLARRLAREVANAAPHDSRSGERDPIAGLEIVSSIAAAIEADPFDYVSRLSTMPAMRTLDRDSRRRIASLAERLIEAIEDPAAAGA